MISSFVAHYVTTTLAGFRFQNAEESRGRRRVCFRLPDRRNRASHHDSRHRLAVWKLPVDFSQHSLENTLQLKVLFLFFNGVKDIRSQATWFCSSNDYWFLIEVEYFNSVLCSRTSGTPSKTFSRIWTKLIPSYPSSLIISQLVPSLETSKLTV